MTDLRTLNLLGALSLALSDRLLAAATVGAAQNASASAALVTIHSYPSLSVERLSRIVGLSHSGTVRLIDRLMERDLVSRRPGSDGRSVALVLTSAGEERVHAILAARQQALSPVLALLGPAEQAQLASLLDRLLNGMTRDATQADQICRLCDATLCPLATCPVECAVAGPPPEEIEGV